MTDKPEPSAGKIADEDTTSRRPESEPRPKEVGGQEGLEPTRYGDWEKDGRCIDF